MSYHWLSDYEDMCLDTHIDLPPEGYFTVGRLGSGQGKDPDARQTRYVCGSTVAAKRTLMALSPFRRDLIDKPWKLFGWAEPELIDPAPPPKKQKRTKRTPYVASPPPVMREWDSNLDNAIRYIIESAISRRFVDYNHTLRNVVVAGGEAKGTVTFIHLWKGAHFHIKFTDYATFVDELDKLMDQLMEYARSNRRY